MIVKRIAASGLMKQHPGEFPARIVLLSINGEVSKFSSHWEIMPEGKKSYFAYGEYHYNVDDARKSFDGRMDRYNVKEDPDFVPDEEWQSI